MPRFLIKKILKKLRLLEIVLQVKRTIFPRHDLAPFATCSPQQLFAIHKSMQYAQDNGISEGSDYYEFGIFSGFTLWYTQRLAQERMVKDVRFFGFDSFLGLPEIKEIDRGEDFAQGWYFCPKKEVERFFNHNGVDWEKTFLVDGEFRKTLCHETIKKYNMRKGFLFVVDCDLYESAVIVLRFMEPLVKDRSIVLFDDWNCYKGDPSKGEQKAFAEFLQRNPQVKAEPFVEYGWHGKGFVLRIA